MGITANNQGSDFEFELVPAGTHLAICYQMIHLGTNDENIMGEMKTLNKVRLTWEIPSEMRTFNEERGPQPMSISKEYTLSTHEKANLRKDLEGWRGQSFTDQEAEAFDITKVLGAACFISVIHKKSRAGKDYAFIQSISKLPKGTQVAPATQPQFYFSLEEAWDMEKFNQIPEWLQKKIKNSQEYAEIWNDNPNQGIDVAPEEAQHQRAAAPAPAAAAPAATQPQNNSLIPEDGPDDLPF